MVADDALARDRAILEHRERLHARGVRADEMTDLEVLRSLERWSRADSYRAVDYCTILRWIMAERRLAPAPDPA